MNRQATVSLQICLAAALSLSAISPALGQLPRPELWVSGDIAVFSNFSDRVAAGFDESEVQTSGFAGGLVFPFVSSHGRTILIVEPTYRMRRFHPSRLPPQASHSPGELHEVSVQLTFRRQLSRHWALILQAVPGLATDFVGPNAIEDGVRYQGATLATYSFSERTTLGLGAVYGNSFGTDFPIPLILVDWNDGNRWRFTATLPGELETWYHTTESLSLGVRGGFEGSNYTTSTLFPAEKPRLQYLAARIGPAIQWQVGPHLAFTADGGLSLQRVRLYDGNRELVVNSNYDLKPTVFSAATMRVTF